MFVTNSTKTVRKRAGLKANPDDPLLTVLVKMSSKFEDIKTGSKALCLKSGLFEIYGPIFGSS